MSPSSFKDGDKSCRLPVPSDASFSFQIPTSISNTDFLLDDNGVDFMKDQSFLATPAASRRNLLKLEGIRNPMTRTSDTRDMCKNETPRASGRVTRSTRAKASILRQLSGPTDDSFSIQIPNVLADTDILMEDNGSEFLEDTSFLATPVVSHKLHPRMKNLSEDPFSRLQSDDVTILCEGAEVSSSTLPLNLTANEGSMTRGKAKKIGSPLKSNLELSTSSPQFPPSPPRTAHFFSGSIHSDELRNNAEFILKNDNDGVDALENLQLAKVAVVGSLAFESLDFPQGGKIVMASVENKSRRGKSKKRTVAFKSRSKTASPTPASVLPIARALSVPVSDLQISTSHDFTGSIPSNISEYEEGDVVNKEPDMSIISPVPSNVAGLQSPVKENQQPFESYGSPTVTQPMVLNSPTPTRSNLNINHTRSTTPKLRRAPIHSILSDNRSASPSEKASFLTLTPIEENTLSCGTKPLESSTTESHQPLCDAHANFVNTNPFNISASGTLDEEDASPRRRRRMLLSPVRLAEERDDDEDERSSRPGIDDMLIDNDPNEMIVDVADGSSGDGLCVTIPGNAVQSKEVVVSQSLLKKKVKFEIDEVKKDVEVGGKVLSRSTSMWSKSMKAASRIATRAAVPRNALPRAPSSNTVNVEKIPPSHATELNVQKEGANEVELGEEPARSQSFACARTLNSVFPTPGLLISGSPSGEANSQLRTDHSVSGNNVGNLIHLSNVTGIEENNFGNPGTRLRRSPRKRQMKALGAKKQTDEKADLHLQNIHQYKEVGSSITSVTGVAKHSLQQPRTDADFLSSVRGKVFGTVLSTEEDPSISENLTPNETEPQSPQRNQSKTLSASVSRGRRAGLASLKQKGRVLVTASENKSGAGTQQRPELQLADHGAVMKIGTLGETDPHHVQELKNLGQTRENRGEEHGVLDLDPSQLQLGREEIVGEKNSPSSLASLSTPLRPRQAPVLQGIKGEVREGDEFRNVMNLSVGLLNARDGSVRGDGQGTAVMEVDPVSDPAGDRDMGDLENQAEDQARVYEKLDGGSGSGVVGSGGDSQVEVLGLEGEGMIQAASGNGLLDVKKRQRVVPPGREKGNISKKRMGEGEQENKKNKRQKVTTLQTSTISNMNTSRAKANTKTKLASKAKVNTSASTNNIDRNKMTKTATKPVEFKFQLDARLEARKADFEDFVKAPMATRATVARRVPVITADTNASSIPRPVSRASISNSSAASRLVPRTSNSARRGRGRWGGRSRGANAGRIVGKENVPIIGVTIPVPFELHTAVRAEERARFDGWLKEKEREKEQEEEERRKEMEEEEEKTVKEMRKKAVPKANEVPEWYKDAPKKGGGGEGVDSD